MIYRALKVKDIFKIYVSFAFISAAPAISYAQDVANPTSPEIEAIAKELEIFVMPRSGPFHPDQIKIENQIAIGNWARSGHSDASSKSFAHWNDAGEIPPVCATCHSGAGFRTFHGLDGSERGPSATPVQTGGVVDCATCHDPGLASIGEVRFPSGLMHPVESTAEASCMTCHQGRASGVQITAAVGTLEADTPDPELNFINPHYAVAAATWLGGYGAAGYHYAEKTYSGRFFHARPVATCVSCHEPHSLEVAQQACLACHEDGTPDNIRLSRISYDGSGNLGKGIRSDITANAERLYSLLAEYAASVAGTPIVYDGHSFPYFFTDANGDGRIDQAGGKAVAYNAWTPRLLKAAYNWKFTTSDAGAFAHNPHYVLELLYDSIEDIAGALGDDFESWNLNR